MRLSRLTLLLVAFLLIACESGLDRRYLDTSLGQPLEIPPDLAQFENESSFDLPEAFGEEDIAGGKTPVLARIDSLKLEGSGELYWLSVEEPIESLYQKVKNFWAYEGYGLVVDEPVIGVMQTEWIYTEEGASQDLAWWETLFASSDLSASQDQFHTRLERGESGEANRIYITHRGTEYVHEVQVGDDETIDEEEDNQWRYRQSEPELEVEMLSRLMIYLGLEQEDVDAQLARASLFKPRALLEVDAEEKSPYLILRDPYHIAWNRVNQTLLRMNYEIVLSEFKSGLSEEGVFIVATEVVEIEEDTGFFSFLSSEERTTRKFTLVLTEETHELTRLVMEDDKGNFDTSEEGAEFIEMLFEQIK